MSAHERYRHTQVSVVTRMILGVTSLVFVVAFVLLSRRVDALFLLPFIGIQVLLLVVFTSITTVVTTDAFSHHFGLGFWRKRVPLERIASVEAVRNRWWYGFGIRLTFHGWLYNVWGLDAVEVRLVDGRTFRVGTDEPAALAEAIRRG